MNANTETDLESSGDMNAEIDWYNEKTTAIAMSENDIMNNGFIFDEYDENENDDKMNETLTTSELLAKLHKQHKMLVKKDRKIKKMKKHLEQYRIIVKSYSAMLDNVFDTLENENENE